MSDFNKFARLVRGERVEDLTPHLFHNDEAVLERIYENGHFNPVSVDIETDGIRVDKARPTLVGIGNTTEAVSFDYPVPDSVAHVLEYPSIEKIFCNGFWFDIPILERVGLHVGGRIEDVRDLRRALSSDSPLSLSFLVSLYGLSVPWKVGANTDDWQYNAQDCIWTARVYEAMKKEMSE